MMIDMGLDPSDFAIQDNNDPDLIGIGGKTK